MENNLDFIDGILNIGSKKEPLFLELDFKILPDIKKIIIREFSNVSINFLNLSNSNLELEILKSANVNLQYCERCSSDNINIYGKVLDDAKITFDFADFSIGNVKSKVTFDLIGNNSSCKYRMSSISLNNDNKIFNISINHIGLNTFGLVDNYGVCKDSSSLSFLGTSYVLNGAKKANTRQNGKIMVFDENSKGICKPILKIDENDIIASHGASLGKPNEEHMFYLMSRGLSKERAKALIVSGYLNPILKSFKNIDAEKEIANVLGVN